MSTAEVAALIALCAALASAIGDVIRQRSAQEITDKEVGHLELFWLSVRDPRWWMGGMGAVANYSLQAGALALGSVMLVTALQVTALLFALPIYARLAHHRVTRWEWTWAVMLAGSLAVLVTVGDPDAGNARGSLGSWLVVAAVMGPVLVLCLVGAKLWARSAVAPVLLAVVAGSSLALFAVLTKGAVGAAASGGFGAFLRAPESYCLLPAALAGMIFSAVGLSRRGADRLVADGDRGQAGGRLAAGHSGPWRDAQCRRTAPVDAARCRRAGGDCHDRAGSR